MQLWGRPDLSAAFLTSTWGAAQDFGVSVRAETGRTILRGGVVRPAVAMRLLLPEILAVGSAEVSNSV